MNRTAVRKDGRFVYSRPGNCETDSTCYNIKGKEVPGVAAPLGSNGSRPSKTQIIIPYTHTGTLTIPSKNCHPKLLVVLYHITPSKKATNSQVAFLLCLEAMKPAQ